MSLTWVFLGAVIGAVHGLDKGRGPEIVFMMLSGMIVLPVLGLFLGLIGGDARGSVLGAAGGLLGSWLAGPVAAPAFHPQTTGLMMTIGAIAGATCFLFVRFLLWKYGMIFKAIRWLAGVTPMAGSRAPRARRFTIPRRVTS
jgi:hypothetical protein